MKSVETPKSVQDAIQIQQELRDLVRLEDDFPTGGFIAGLDVGYDPKNNLAKAALVTMTLDNLKVVQSIAETEIVTFPYISGLLSFRETPVILKALARLKGKPDILFIDGQGVAHPRRLGIASHIGVMTDLPTIGVAKSRLCGKYDEPAATKGSLTPLMDKDEQIGTVLRSRDNVKPLFISPGHRVSHKTAIELVLKCLIQYRLPEPTRMADKVSKFKQKQAKIL